MKRLVKEYINLTKEVYNRTPDNAEIKNVAMRNELPRSVIILRSLKKADDNLIKQGIHCHLY